MREIKFRAKIITNGLWVHGNLLLSETPVNGMPKAYIASRFADSHNIREIAVDPKTVGQFTGLKDSKGNEIYEGDILEWKHSEQGDTDNYFSKREPVVFDNGSFGFERWSLSNGCLMEKLTHVSAHAATDDLYYIEFEAKKIGNIHEHPELLKQK